MLKQLPAILPDNRNRRRRVSPEIVTLAIRRGMNEDYDRGDETVA